MDTACGKRRLKYGEEALTAGHRLENIEREAQNMAEVKEQSEIAKEMDAAAEKAAKELGKLDKKAVALIAGWMKTNLATAGYKRLGRALVATQKTAKPAKTEE